jgi:hypothetical protein
MNRRLTLAALLTTGVFATNGMADTISINRMNVHDIKSTYFQLDDDQKVEIEFLAPKQDEDDANDFVWILDLNTRETVWRSRRAEVIESAKNDKLEIYGDKISLDKGRYGIFFSTHNFSYRSHQGMDIILYGLSSLFAESNRITRDDIEEFYVDLRAEDVNSIARDTSFKPFGDATEVVNFRKVRKNEYEQFGLNVKKDTDLSIYALGEIDGNDVADYAWLKNANTGEVVWKMDRKTTDAAGGAKKNRKFKGTVPVAKGQYVLSYSSDGSHHYNDWNNRPPYDPVAWGISVYASEGIQVETFDPEKKLKDMEILAINKVGNNAHKYKHFKLTKATDVRVYALGERAGSKTMADHGWIVDNTSREKVWQMKARETEHAGGSSKNRVADDVISLPKGEYTVYYVTDGSHSYQDGWNSSRPHDQKKWGITLYGVGEGFDKKSVEIMDSANSNAVAQIIGVGEGQKRSATFEIDKDQDVRVYAIGEGDGDEMSDYAYIKNADTGKRVWSMHSDETEHAGGARKNRMSNDTIYLKKGKYKVYFRTDGSHSFGDWNAAPPTDQYNYGVTVFSLIKK